MLAAGMKRRRQQSRPVLVAVPTPERLAKAGGDIELGDDKRGRVIITVRDSPLERARHRGAISEAQYHAGSKYRHHWRHAGLEPRYATIDHNRVLGSHGAGMLATEAASFHHQRYREAVQELGQKDSSVLEWIVCLERSLEDTGRAVLGWDLRDRAIVAATERLRSALDTLCALWGL